MKVIKPGFEIIHHQDPLKTIEAVGRTCYKSEDRITDDSATAFVANLIKRGHEAMLEHFVFIFEMTDSIYESMKDIIASLEDHGFNNFLRITYTDRAVISGNVRAWRDFLRYAERYLFFIPGFMAAFITAHPILFPEYQSQKKWESRIATRQLIRLSYEDLHEGIEQWMHRYVTVRFTNDRGVSHEQVRHRVASFGQESTRYCNYTKEKFGSEITHIDIRGGMELDSVVSNLDSETQGLIFDEWVAACEDAERHYNNMIALGATPQIARSVLNNSTKTEICVTMSLVDWNHFFTLRCPTSAHPSMREVAIPLLEDMKMHFSEYFDNITC